MNLTTFRSAASVFLLVSLSSGLIASEWHVAPPPLGDDSNPGTNELPFATIQRGIDAASPGDTVIVAEGTYVENIQFDDKNILLTSTDPLNPVVVQSTIIDGNKAGSVVTFSGTETEACILSGFTIRNGQSVFGGGICGGTWDVRTHATIENNRITGNSAMDGGGLRYCGGTIQNNTITGNSALHGGGLFGCDGAIQNNTITGNSAQYGGGLGECSGTIRNNTITSNSAQAYGGGLRYCAGTIQNNTITGNSATYDGGGLAYCNGTIQNNRITDNSAGLDGGGLHSCNGTIRNNTITGNSAGLDGGGLFGCDAAIQNNTITGNSATGEYSAGGGLYGCDGAIQSNTITGNSALYGGGLCTCYGTIQNNGITGNSATYDGGGLARCMGTIHNNTITGNSAEVDGGGLVFCDGTTQNNTITGNTAGSGGGLAKCHGTIQNNTITGNSAEVDGGGLRYCGGTIQNNTITRNSAEWAGGGLSDCHGTILNNTVTGNSAQWHGGGLYYCNGTIRNCIVWANTAPSRPQLHDSSIPNFSCIESWSGGGEGNTASEPRFLDLKAGDYRLQEGSPCIDAGYNDPALPATDIAGMHRVMYGGKSLTVDMGAWEYYVNILSRELGGNAVLTWSSVAGKTYSIYRSSDMVNWQTAEELAPSMGEMTTQWLDPTQPLLSPGVRCRFYRIKENQ